MEKSSVEAIANTLNAAAVRYLIAGGLAVVAHGYVRFTADLDVIIDLEPANVGRAVAALSRLGYRPRAPVGLSEFADPKKRAMWVREKGLTVFSLYSPAHPATEIDLFVEPPIDFNAAETRGVSIEIAPGKTARICGLHDLIELKLRAGRKQDLDDVAELRKLHAKDLT